MSIQSFLNQAAVQTAVYWGNPVENGHGGKTFSAPVEIKCHWEDKQQIIGESQGVQLLSRAIVYLTQDVDPEGMLFLGTIEDLYDLAESSAGSIDNPFVFDKVCIIKRFEKTPALRSTTEYLRKAFLTPWLT